MFLPRGDEQTHTGCQAARGLDPLGACRAGTREVLAFIK